MALREDELAGLCDDVDLERDRVLVERCQAGDSAAFGNLYARYYERLLRFCMRRLNDRHEAEDAAQEAFARAWKALPRFAGDKRFYPWLTVIAGNICTDMLRRRSRSTPTDDMELTAQQPWARWPTTRRRISSSPPSTANSCNRALDRLSVRHRHVLAMREGSGWTYQQIADHEGVEIGTIETLLWRARQALKREFAAVSESKGALAGFLVASGALFRRAFFRVAHRGRHHAAAGRGHIGRHGLAQRAGRGRRGRCRRGGGIHCAPRTQGQRHQRGSGRAGGQRPGGAAARPGAGTGSQRCRGRAPRSARWPSAGGSDGGSLPPGGSGSGTSDGSDGLR